MNFAQTIDYLEGLEESKMRLDLEPSQHLLELLGRPDRRLKSVIVAGTNGKGSTCAYLTSIAEAAGLNVGTYTSPHIEHLRERIAINGRPISEEDFAEAASTVREVIQANRFLGTTYFEFLTMTAVVAFEKARVDLAIFEVGLGGRLDTTNALDRVGVILTTIDFDHTNILGDTLPQIAWEKGSILRKDRFAVISKQQPEARVRLAQMVKDSGAQAFWCGTEFAGSGTDLTFRFESGPVELGPVRLGIQGEPQVINAACAAQAAMQLDHLGIGISPEAISKGLEKTKIAGRLERWTNRANQEVWLDVAHNRGAMEVLVHYLKLHQFTGLHGVVGILKDKEWKPMLQILSQLCNEITICRPDSERAWDPEEAAMFARTLFSIVHVETNPVRAFNGVLENTKAIVCTGSFYILGSLRSRLKELEFNIEPLL